MLLGNRRLRILYLALAGMETAWLLPFVLTWISRSRVWHEFRLPVVAKYVLDQPLAIFGVCWLTMVVYMLATDLMDRREVDTPRRELIIVSLVVVSSVAGVRLLLHPLASYADMGWLYDTVSSIFDFSDGLRPPLLLILVNVFLWIRVAIAADREISFFGVGVSFRLGMLLSLLGGTLLSTIGGQPATLSLLYFTLFLLFGLVAVALARIDEKAVGATNSSGASLPYSRLAQIIVLILAIFMSSLAVQHFLNPGAIRYALSVLEPVWRVFAWALTGLLLLVFLLIAPLLERLMLTLERLAADAEPVQPTIQAPLPTDYLGVETMVREWIVLRYCLVAGAIVLVLALLWFLFVQVDDRNRSVQSEESTPEESSSGLAMGRPRLDRLRQWLNLLRKYGVSQRLLNVVTVQNMYANLGRLARKRGYPRRVSQPPDAYLPDLQNAFPGQGPGLGRMTQAYMQVHYGDLDVDKDELLVLREDYARIVETPPPDSSE